MKRRVLWAPEALRDFSEQMAFIARDDEAAARLVRSRVDDAIGRLAEKPVGRMGRVSGTYEKRVLRTRYIVAFELPNERLLHILRIIHSSRDWPAGRWPRQN